MKTRSVLKGLWLEPWADLIPLANRGVEILAELDAPAVPALCWGMAIMGYPFFGKVAELIGRLTSIQGECTSAPPPRFIAVWPGPMANAKLPTALPTASCRPRPDRAPWSASTRAAASSEDRP